MSFINLSYEEQFTTFSFIPVYWFVIGKNAFDKF